MGSMDVVSAIVLGLMSLVFVLFTLQIQWWMDRSVHTKDISRYIDTKLTLDDLTSKEKDDKEEEDNEDD